MVPQGEAEEVAVGQAQHALLERDDHFLGEADFSRAIVAQARAPQHVGAILHERDKAHLRVGTAPPTRRGATEGLHVFLLVGHLQRTAVQTHQTPAPVPSPQGVGAGHGLHHFVMQLPQDGPAQPRARLRNSRFAGDLHAPARPPQPRQAFQQTAQHLTIGHLHEQRQSNDIVNDHVRRQIALPPARLLLARQHGLHLRQGKSPGQHPQTDVIGNSRPPGKFSDSSRHRNPPLKSTEKRISQI